MLKKKLTIKEIGIQKLIIIFASGILLILLSFPNSLPFNKKSISTNTKKNSLSGSVKESLSDLSADGDLKFTNEMENKLENLLQKVDGVGKVKVMITLKSSEERVTLKNSPYSQESTKESDSTGGSRVSSNISKEEETVLINNDEGNSVPYVIKENMPEIEGVVIIAQGGGKSTTISEIIDVAMVLFDVPAHKIKVMKME